MPLNRGFSRRPGRRASAREAARLVSLALVLVSFVGASTLTGSACGGSGGTGGGDGGPADGGDGGGGDGGGDGGIASCTPAPAGGGCPDAAWPLYCGACTPGNASCAAPGICCGASNPFYCATSNLCYSTAAQAAAACGAQPCAACYLPVQPSCTPPTASADCEPGRTYCGASLCCGSSYPFTCPAGTACYATAGEAAAACGAACLACVAPAGGSGSLQVTVTGLPAGLDANVLVTGPGGYGRQLTTTATLTGLAPGSYGVQAKLVRQTGTVVDTLFDAVGGTAAVMAGATASASVAYAQRPGTGVLWVPSFGDGTNRLIGKVAVTPPSGVYPGLAFDGVGSMWVSDAAHDALYKYTPSQLAAGGSLPPAVTITAIAGSLRSPTGLAFDHGGNLWVGNGGAGSADKGSLVMFTPPQLAESGGPTPAVIIGEISNSLNGPTGLAFDTSGSLWVGNLGANTLVKFTKEQLSASGSPVPAVTVGRGSDWIGLLPLTLAFDSGGNLWVGGYMGKLGIVKFAPSQLASSGTPVPGVTLTTFADGMTSAHALAFDTSGNLWALITGRLVQFPKSRLGASGAPEPGVLIDDIYGSRPTMIAFDPPPASLPLHQARDGTPVAAPGGGSAYCIPAVTEACSPGYPLSCGGSMCCPAGRAFLCAADQRCHGTAAEASASCPVPCLACAPHAP